MVEKSLKQSSIVSVGIGLNGLLGLLFYLLLIRHISVASFGQFSLLLAVGVLAAELADLGLNSALLKFSPDSTFQKVTTFAIYQRLLASIVLIVIFLLAQAVFGLNFLLSGALAVVVLWFGTLIQAFVAKEKFFWSTGLNIFSNSLRLSLIFLLISYELTSVNTALGIFILSYFLAFLIGAMFLFKKPEFRLVSLVEARKFSREVLSFSLWIGGSQALSALTAKLDSPMLFAFAGPIQTGLYSSAQKLSSIISQFAFVLETVFAPKLAKTGSSSHFKTYVLLASLVFALILLAIPFARPLVALLFPPDYLTAVPVLEVMLVGYALFFLGIPFSTSTVYVFGKSKIHLSNATLQLIATVVLYIFLLPTYGAIGAAITFCLVNLIFLLLFTYYHFRLTKKAS